MFKTCHIQWLKNSNTILKWVNLSFFLYSEGLKNGNQNPVNFTWNNKLVPIPTLQISLSDYCIVSSCNGCSDRTNKYYRLNSPLQDVCEQRGKSGQQQISGTLHWHSCWARVMHSLLLFIIPRLILQSRGIYRKSSPNQCPDRWEEHWSLVSVWESWSCYSAVALWHIYDKDDMEFNQMSPSFIFFPLDCSSQVDGTYSLVT